MTVTQEPAAPPSSRGPATRTRRASSSATACASSTRSTATASRRCCCCRPGRSSTRGTGRCRFRTSRATAGSSPSTGAATGAPTGRRGRAYTDREFAADALAVLDATATERAVVVGALRRRALGDLLAAEHPERVAARRSSAPAVPLAPGNPERACPRLRRALDTDDGWAKYNRHYWLGRDYPRTSSSSSSAVFTEPHSTKQIEDCVGWGLETDAGDARQTDSRCPADRGKRIRELAARIRCPALVIHGDRGRDPGPMRRGRRSPSTPAGPSSRSRAPATSRRPATR